MVRGRLSRTTPQARTLGGDHGVRRRPQDGPVGDLAGGLVVVHEPGRLHQRVRRRRPHEADPLGTQRLGQRRRLGRDGPELAGLLKAGSANLQGKATPRELIENTYLAALSRKPTDSEVRIATDILGETPTSEATEDFLWSVFMLPEFIYIN